jgi:hypothetical protein
MALAHPLARTHLHEVATLATEATTRAPAGASPGGRAQCAHGVMGGRRRASFPLSPALFLQGLGRRGRLHAAPHARRDRGQRGDVRGHALLHPTRLHPRRRASPSAVQAPPRWGRVDQPCPGAVGHADVVGAYDGPRGQGRDPRRHGGRPRVDPVRTPAWLLGRAVFAPHGSPRAGTQLGATPLINSTPSVLTQPPGEEQRVRIRSELSLIEEDEEHSATHTKT